MGNFSKFPLSLMFNGKQFIFKQYKAKQYQVQALNEKIETAPGS